MERKVYSAILREDRETDIQFNFDRIWVDTNTIAMLYKSNVFGRFGCKHISILNRNSTIVSVKHYFFKSKNVL